MGVGWDCQGLRIRTMQEDRRRMEAQAELNECCRLDGMEESAQAQSGHARGRFPARQRWIRQAGPVGNSCATRRSSAEGRLAQLRIREGGGAGLLQVEERVRDG